MSNRDQRLIEAAMRYLALFESGSAPNLDDFVATVDRRLRAELRRYLEEVLATGTPVEPILLSPEEQALSARARTRAGQRFDAKMRRVQPPRTLRDVRQDQRQSLEALAARLNLPPELLERLERGEILGSTIPNRLIARLAQALRQTEAFIRAILGAPPGSAPAGIREEAIPYGPAQEDSATVASTKDQVSFAEALRVSAPTPMQLAEWDESSPA
ncbi:MAG TPA: hypothetical protein VER55_07910 [Ardenticatenaceae bacterium]|nr:hypothetical protein [Ardenticatenaceae bacterium]